MMRRTALAAGFLLVPGLVVGGEAAATTSDSTTATAPARTTATSGCSTPARRGFVPTNAKVANVGRNIAVYAVATGGTPPLTTAGKAAFSWDKYGPKPGDAYGNVRFTAHTYPDGSALGNRLLKRLRIGARIVLRGGSSMLCYRVKRVKVTTPTRLGGYYNTTGRPKLAIVVCSGKRLGPGNWTNRTIWIARPSTS
jgi:hypothetical protein